MAIVAALTPLSWLYRVGLKLFLLPYQMGLRKQHRLPRRVVCVGNLTFGGTGKTPAVEAICRQLIAEGVRPAILTRGHGGRLAGITVVVGKTSAELVGDEAAMLSSMLPEVPVGVGRRREQSGLEVLAKQEADIFVLDDGLQYWQLHYDFEIVVMSAGRPLGSGRVMPAGDLREPPGRLKKADAVILVGDEGVATAKEIIDRLAPYVPIFRAKKQPIGLSNIADGEEKPLDWLRGRRVWALSAIGDPGSFETTLMELGADIRGISRFQDHHQFTEYEQIEVDRQAESAGCEAVVTTLKDAARLNRRSGKLPVFVLGIILKIEDITRLTNMILLNEQA